MSEDWAEKLRRGNSGTNYQTGRERRGKRKTGWGGTVGWEERGSERKGTIGEERGRREVRKKTRRNENGGTGEKKEKEGENRAGKIKSE